MSRKLIIPALLIMLSPAFIYCQTVHFSYDKNGNRTGRVLEAQQLKSATIDFPVVDQNTLEPVEKEEEKMPGEETAIKIYPNPTRGILKAEILNLPDDVETALMLFDMSGMKLIDQNNLSQVFDLDISRFKDGLYILRIVIDNKVTNWKIIKNSY